MTYSFMLTVLLCLKYIIKMFELIQITVCSNWSIFCIIIAMHILGVPPP